MHSWYGAQLFCLIPRNREEGGMGMKKVAIKITSVVMAFMICFSVTNIVSAETLTPSAEKVVKELAIKKIKDYSEVLGKTVGEIPYIGGVCKELLNYLVQEILPEEKKTDPLEGVNNKLDEIEEKISDMSVKQDLAENKSFDDLCNSLSVYCENADKYILTIQDDKNCLKEYQEEYDKLNAKTDRTDEENARISKLKKLIKDCNEDISNNQNDLIALVTETKNSTSMKSTMLLIEKYITDQATGQDKNPFKNYFDAKNKELHFTSDALKASQVYESKIMSTYINAVAIRLRMLSEKCEISSNDQEIKNLQKEAEELNNTSKKVLESYTSIANEEANTTNKYYDSKGEFITLESVGKAEIEGLSVYSMGSNSQQSLARYFSKSNVDGHDKSFDSYMSKIQSMISENYKSDSDMQKYTLRQFIESKGIDLPDEAKYLIAGHLKASGITMFDVKYYLPVYELDKSSNQVKDILVGYPDILKNKVIEYVDSKDLCYFIEEKDISDAAVAQVIVDGHASSYSDFATAWNAAAKIADERKTAFDITFKLLSDWNATEYADGRYDFGSGIGFKNGALYIDDYVILDLNGHKIDRRMKKAKEDGSVIIVNSVKFKITDSSGNNNGLITGGYTTGDGGGIYLKGVGRNDCIIENCIISGNIAEGNGGGVKLVPDRSVSFYNVEITGNMAGKQGGGVATDPGGILESPTKIWMGSKVIIKDNYKRNTKERNDCYLADCMTTKSTISIDSRNPLTSNSMIYIISNTNDKTLTVVEKTNRNYINNFWYDDTSKYSINSAGSGNSQYLYIKKVK